MSHQSASTHKAISEFLAEAEEIADRLGSELADLADLAENGTTDQAPDLVNSIFRGAHSLKGLAGMFGFSDISELAHNMESLLDLLRLGRLDVSHSVMTALFEAQELLHALVRAVPGGDAAPRSAAIASCVAGLAACLTPPDQPRSTSGLTALGLDGHIRAALTEYEEHRLHDNLLKGKNIYVIHTSFELATFDEELSRLSDLLKTGGEVISTLPSVDGNMDTHIDFDLLFGSVLGQAELERLLDGAPFGITLLGEGASGSLAPPRQAPPSPLPAGPVPEAGTPDTATAAMAASTSPGGETGQAAAGSRSAGRTVRVDIGKLDELMNIVGELVLAHSSIAGIAAMMLNENFSRRAVDLGKAVKALERKVADLRNGVMEIRMIPVGQLYEKMSRIVRKISREQGKKVELAFFGAETELDKLIVEDISNPIMHIVRNAIDHGIESAGRRAELGKDEKGNIRIASYQKGNRVVIEIEDDGAGIDTDKIRARAARDSLVPDAEALSDKDALDLIFLPGFSTSDTVSDVSGRGVGMDVVRNDIAAISGLVDIETSRGRGTRFTITLPITLAIIKVLVVSCSGRTYALPVTSVIESLLLTGDDVATVERREVIHLRDATLPMLRLERYFGLERREKGPDEFYAVVVGVAERRLGIAVDELCGQQDVVIKSLGTAFSGLRGVSGAADLGDQRTILVLDVAAMIAETLKNGN